MKKKGLKFQVTVPVVIFRLLGIIYFVTSVLLSLFFFVRCRGTDRFADVLYMPFLHRSTVLFCKSYLACGFL